MMPIFKACYVCHHEQLRSSLHIHETQCLRKWKDKNDSLPEEEKLPVPMRPGEVENEEYGKLVEKEKTEKAKENLGRCKWNHSTRDPEISKMILQKTKVSDDTVFEHSSNKTLVETNKYAAFDISPPSPEPTQLVTEVPNKAVIEREKLRRSKLDDRWSRLSTLPKRRTPPPRSEDSEKLKPRPGQGKSVKHATPVRAITPDSAKRQPNKTKPQIKTNDRKQTTKSAPLTSKIDNRNTLPNKPNAPNRSKENPRAKIPEAGASGTIGNRAVYPRKQNALKNNPIRQNESMKKNEDKDEGKDEGIDEDVQIVPVKKTISTTSYVISQKELLNDDDIERPTIENNGEMNQGKPNEITNANELNKEKEITVAENEKKEANGGTQSSSKGATTFWNWEKAAKKQNPQKQGTSQIEYIHTANRPAHNTCKNAAVNTPGESEETNQRLEEIREIAATLCAEVNEIKAWKESYPKINEVVKAIQTVEEERQAHAEGIDSNSHQINTLNGVCENIIDILSKKERNQGTGVEDITESKEFQEVQTLVFQAVRENNTCLEKAKYHDQQIKHIQDVLNRLENRYIDLESTVMDLIFRTFTIIFWKQEHGSNELSAWPDSLTQLEGECGNHSKGQGSGYEDPEARLHRVRAERKEKYQKAVDDWNKSCNQGDSSNDNNDNMSKTDLDDTLGRMAKKTAKYRKDGTKASNANATSMTGEMNKGPADYQEQEMLAVNGKKVEQDTGASQSVTLDPNGCQSGDGRHPISSESIPSTKEQNETKSDTPLQQTQTAVDFPGNHRKKSTISNWVW